ncbi:MAG TPA: UDP-3-O-(3-hydroxymyristoyl)glucosamine N-acyltransferase [Gemmatimonadaceae bacterium]|jgi:UDP-3-O-[3-hydroxymyristoyl] glucosamine N-acyltransferase|nr:UDP-3-O-(3-hydroxymyristoyl)glucosamine N-acyltransferase [Gemmatimonadaceae bacterium]
MHQPRLRLQELLDGLSPAYMALVSRIVTSKPDLANVYLRGGRALDSAEPDDLVFCKDESPNTVQAAIATRSQIIVARPALLALLPGEFTRARTLILTSHPRLILATLLQAFDTVPGITTQQQSIHDDARIAPGTILGQGVVVGADVEIHERCIIGPNTVIDHATLGTNTRIGANCSIGGDGFGFEIDESSGEVIKFPHFGRVRIGQNVEIFSNTCIARGSLRDTVIGNNVKIDNLVHIAHNVEIGDNAFVIANAMLAGSTKIGTRAWIGPSTSILNGITVGDLSMTGVGAVVTHSCGKNEIVAGVPAKRLRDRFSKPSQ